MLYLGIGDARDRLFLRGAPGAARGQAVYLYGTWCLTKTPLVFFSTVNGRGGVKDRFSFWRKVSARHSRYFLLQRKAWMARTRTCWSG